MINVSVVIYNTDRQQVLSLLEILSHSKNVQRIFIIDNSPVQTAEYLQLPVVYSSKTEYIFCNENLGYGKAHNIGIRRTIEQGVEYHLVLNSDIKFDAKILDEMECFMQQHPNIGQMMPKVVYPNGDIQYLCKLLPTPLDLFGRRFLPKSLMKRRMHRFELRDSGYNHIINVPYLSGCFMLLRTAALQETGLFDERFFMYPEDIDLTRRIHRRFLTVFYPYATIVHEHEQSSYHSYKMMWIHIVNLCRYFNKYGWIFDSERHKVNKTTLSAIGKSDTLHTPKQE